MTDLLLHHQGSDTADIGTLLSASDVGCCNIRCSVTFSGDGLFTSSSLPCLSLPGASNAVYPPNNLGALPPILTSPPFSATPHPLPLPAAPPPANNFWTFYTQFCAILCVFSVNFGSWQSEIMTQKNEEKNYKCGWLNTLHACICKLRIKRNRCERSEREIFLRK